MKGMGKIKRGKGFAGVLRYAKEGEKDAPRPGRLIGGTMAGKDTKQLAAEFKVIAARRPDIEKPVWHQSLRMPENEDVTDEKWEKLVHDYMVKMGWDPEKTQYCIYKHDGEDHIHIIANRVLLDGSVYLGQNENLMSTRVVAELEKMHGLTITKGPTYDPEGKIVMPEKSRPKKNEMEKGLRLGVLPPRVVIQKTLDEALADRLTMGAFLERMDAAGIEAIPTISPSTGRMSGFSFRRDGIKFSGSELGAKYKWAALQKGIDYDQARDTDELVRRRGASAGGEVAAGSPAADQFADRPGEGVAGPDRAAGGSDHADSPGAAGNPEPAAIGRAPADGHGGGATEGGGRQAGDARGANDTPPVAPGSGLDEAVRVVRKIAGPAEAKDVAAKLDAWRRQQDALNAPAYRITMTDRVLTGGIDRTHNIGKLRDGSGEVVYTAEQVAQMIPKLRASNARGFDVYITPMDKAHHYIVIDDMTAQTLEQMKADGYAPCLVQQSSAGNLQAIVKVPRADRKDEQQIANKLVVDLNKRYGDPKFSGVIHPFRMAGFSNKKPGRNNAFTRVVAAARTICNHALQTIQTMRTNVDSEALNAKAADVKRQRIDTIERPASWAAAGPMRMYQERARYMLVENPVMPDWSAIDFGVSCEMLKRGHSPGQIADALRHGSPAIGERHADIDDYVSRTVQAAAKRVGWQPPAGSQQEILKPKE